MKSKLLKISKSIMSFVILFASFLVVVAPITKVSAISYGTGDNFLKVNITNTLGFTVNGVTVNNSTWTNSDDEFHTTDKQYNVEVSVSKNEGTAEKVPGIMYGGNWNEYVNVTSSHEGDNYTFTLNINDSQNQGFIDIMLVEQEQNPNPGEDPNEGHFDGKAYLIWTCETGKICYHYFDNIPVNSDGSSVFYRASEITDDKTNEVFSINSNKKAWATKNMFDSWVSDYKLFKGITGELDFDTVDPEDMIGDPIDMREYEEKAINAGTCTKEGKSMEEFQDCVDTYVATVENIFPKRARLQPLPDEPTDNNAYVSYGDRNFKVVIYNDEYKGVSLGSLSQLNYYPSYYTNAYIRQDQFDISGTSETNPTVIDSILLERTVTIKTLNYNGFDIENIVALNVPNEAVSINKENGEWKITFSSHFYDNVVFKVTDTNGETEYFRIHRYTIDGNLRYKDDKYVIVSDFYFSNQNSYTDFDVTLNIIYKDGTTKKAPMSAAYGIDDGLGNMTWDYEVDEESGGEFGFAGKGLKKSTFEYVLNDNDKENISKAYINVEYKGSTQTTYAGAFAGSGEGVEVNFGGEE